MEVIRAAANFAKNSCELRPTSCSRNQSSFGSHARPWKHSNLEGESCKAATLEGLARRGYLVWGNYMGCLARGSELETEEEESRGLSFSSIGCGSSSRVRVGASSAALRRSRSFAGFSKGRRRYCVAPICGVENGVASEAVLDAPPSHPPGAVMLQSPSYIESLKQGSSRARALTSLQESVSGLEELTELSPFRPGHLVECFEVEGGRRLSGEVQISGAKNAALAVLAGAICSQGQVHLEMIPDLHDIRRMFQVLQSVGVKVQRTSASGFMIDARDLTSVEPCPDAVRKLRASFFVIGSLLGRTGEAVVPLPGGCDIGARPIDLHVRGLEALGANVDIRQGKVHARAHNGRSLTGGTFSLDYPSVGATETLLMAAALADGHTTLSNVAQVPVPMRHTSFLHKDEDLVLSELRCWIHRVLMFDSFWYSGTGSGRSCKFFGIMWGMYTRSWNQHFEYYRNEETAWYRVPDYTRSD